MPDRNEWSETLADKLHRATARHLPADAELDAQTSALRDGWLALSQLLEAADADQPELTVTFPAAVPAAIPPAIAMSRGKLWLAILSLAASLLLIATGAWLVVSQWKSNTSDGKPVAKSLPTQNQNPPNVAPLPSTEMAHESNNREWTWDDSLDLRIADVSEAARQVQTVSRSADRDLDFVDWRLEEMSRDLATDSL